MTRPDWRVRPCPLCVGTDTVELAAPSVDAVSSANPGYRGRLAADLGAALGSSTALPIVECRRCRFVFAGLEPPTEVLALVYGEPASTAAAKEKAQVPGKRLRRLDDWHRLLGAGADRAEVSVVDYGCGWGAFLSAARSPGVRVVGIEPYQRVEADGTKGLDFPVVERAVDLDERFDLFMCDQVLEHVADPVSAGRELRSVLRDGALGVLGVPNFGRFDWAAERRRLAAGGPVSTKDINPIEHLNYFSGRHLAAALRSAGFAPVARPGLGRLDALEQRVLDGLRSVRRRASTHRFARAVGASA